MGICDDKNWHYNLPVRKNHRHMIGLGAAAAIGLSAGFLVPNPAVTEVVYSLELNPRMVLDQQHVGDHDSASYEVVMKGFNDAADAFVQASQAKLVGQLGRADPRKLNTDDPQVKRVRLENGAVGIQVTDQVGGGDLDEATFSDLVSVLLETYEFSPIEPGPIYVDVYDNPRIESWQLALVFSAACIFIYGAATLVLRRDSTR